MKKNPRTKTDPRNFDWSKIGLENKDHRADQNNADSDCVSGFPKTKEPATSNEAVPSSATKTYNKYCCPTKSGNVTIDSPTECTANNGAVGSPNPGACK